MDQERECGAIRGDLLKTKILPGIHRVEGYRGATLLRRRMEGGTEFVTLTFFESMEAVRAFAGEDFERAVVPPEARRLLSSFGERGACGGCWCMIWRLPRREWVAGVVEGYPSKTRPIMRFAIGAE